MNKELSNSLKKNGSKNFGEAIISNFEELGLGVLSKSDFEAYMFHHLILNTNSKKLKTSYDWMRVLKLTPSKYRSLQMIRSAKFLDLDLSNSDNWKLIFNSLEKKKIEIENKDNGKVRVYIDDLHVHRLIERFVIEGGSSVDYSLNKNQLVIKYSEFLHLINNILIKSGKENLLTSINKDRSSIKIEKEFTSLDTVLEDIKSSFKDATFSSAAEAGVGFVIKVAKKKLGI